MKIEHTLDRLAKLKDQKKLKEAQALKLEKKEEISNDRKNIQASPGAKINISDKAKELSKMKEIASGDENSNAEKIARLKQLIAEKKYNVDAEKIADKMVDEHLKNEVS